MASFSSSVRHLRRFLSTSAKPSWISTSKAMSKLRGEHDPDKALELYSSVANLRSSSPTNRIFAQDLTVRRLAKSGRFSDIESFLESLKNDPEEVKHEPYLSTLIRSYGRAGMFDHALRTFEQMDELGTPRSSTSFNALLIACVNSKLFDNVPQLFDEMPKRYGFSPDGISYGILIKAYCEKGLTDKAVETVGEIEKNGIEVSAVTFTTILNALYKTGEREEAEKLWETMVKKGCEIDVAAYNVRIGHCHGGKPGNVKALFKEMADAGVKPDTISYNYLMTCYCESGRIDEAKKIYEGLEGNGCNPNAATFRVLVDYLCRNGDFERAYKVFKKSVMANKIPGFDTLELLVEGLAKMKKMKEAKGMLRSIKKKLPSDALNQWRAVEERLGLASRAA